MWSQTNTTINVANYSLRILVRIR